MAVCRALNMYMSVRDLFDLKKEHSEVKTFEKKCPLSESGYLLGFAQRLFIPGNNTSDDRRVGL